MSKAVITDHTFPSSDLQRQIIESAGFEFADIQPKCKTEDDVIANCGDADVLLVQWAPITRRVLEALPRVKCIVRYGVGVDNFDLQAAKDLGVMACNVPDFCVDEVSDHAAAMIISLARRLPHDHNGIIAGGWGINHLRPIEAPVDMTVGLVSFGKIAQKTADKCAAFGFKLIGFDPYVDESVFAAKGVKKVDFDELIRTADVVSLHCPLTPETKHLMNKEAFEKMKPRSIVVNVARGPVVDEPALIEALASGKLSGAGLDVFEVEPLPADSPLRGFSNVILTSHAASVSERAATTLPTKAAEAARDFLQGKRPASVLVG